MQQLKPILRYPGSKAKLIRQIVDRFDHRVIGGLFSQTPDPSVYVEPFTGSGAVAAAVMPIMHHKSRVWLNDADRWIYCAWQSILVHSDELFEMIRDYTPSVDDFYKWKEQDGETISTVEAGFRKIVLHYISFSGLGSMAGGPIGGVNQGKAKYKVGCRWNPDRLIDNYTRWSRTLNLRDASTTNYDFRQVLNLLASDAFVYADPPYYHQGAGLYKHSFTDADHDALADILRAARYRWALSYDDCPEIRSRYHWADIVDIDVRYTASTKAGPTRPTTSEILILPG